MMHLLLESDKCLFLSQDTISRVLTLEMDDEVILAMSSVVLELEMDPSSVEFYLLVLDNMISFLVNDI